MSSGEDYLKDVVGMIDELIGELNTQAANALSAH